MQIPQLTFTRFLAAISIVILHFGLTTWPINTDYLFPFFSKAISAISFFFVLSGFILVVSSAKNKELPEKISKRSFWIRRAARIIPIYLFALLIFFFINFEFDSQDSLIWRLQPYGFSTVLLQSWHYELAMDVNFPAWSLSVEAFFYFIFPWLYFVLQKMRNVSLILLGIAVWTVNVVLLYYLVESDFSENFFKFFPLLHLSTFILGVASGILFIRNEEWCKTSGRVLILVATSVLTIGILISAYLDYGFYNYQHNGLMAPYFIIVFISLAIMKGPIIKLLSSKAFIYLGDISYSIYILQLPVFQICMNYIPWFEGKSEEQFFFYYLAILILCSAVTYQLIEKKARLYIVQKFKAMN